MKIRDQVLGRDETARENRPQFALEKHEIRVRQPIGDVQAFGFVGNGQVVQPDRLGIPLFDDGLQFIHIAEIVVGGALLGQVGLAAQLDALDAIAPVVVKHVDDLAVDRGDPEVPGHGLGAAAPVRDDPHVDAAAAHGAGQYVVKLVVADHAGGPPLPAGAFQGGVLCCGAHRRAA